MTMAGIFFKRERYTEMMLACKGLEAQNGRQPCGDKGRDCISLARDQGPPGAWRSWRRQRKSFLGV
jgi:hypothetical protein